MHFYWVTVYYNFTQAYYASSSCGSHPSLTLIPKMARVIINGVYYYENTGHLAACSSMFSSSPATRQGLNQQLACLVIDCILLALVSCILISMIRPKKKKIKVCLPFQTDLKYQKTRVSFFFCMFLSRRRRLTYWDLDVSSSFFLSNNDCFFFHMLDWMFTKLGQKHVWVYGYKTYGSKNSPGVIWGHRGQKR